MIPHRLKKICKDFNRDVYGHNVYDNDFYPLVVKDGYIAETPHNSYKLTEKAYLEVLDKEYPNQLAILSVTSSKKTKGGWVASFKKSKSYQRKFKQFLIWLRQKGYINDNYYLKGDLSQYYLEYNEGRHNATFIECFRFHSGYLKRIKKGLLKINKSGQKIIWNVKPVSPIEAKLNSAIDDKPTICSANKNQGIKRQDNKEGLSVPELCEKLDKPVITPVIAELMRTISGMDKKSNFTKADVESAHGSNFHQTYLNTLVNNNLIEKKGKNKSAIIYAIVSEAYYVGSKARNKDAHQLDNNAPENAAILGKTTTEPRPGATPEIEETPEKPLMASPVIEATSIGLNELIDLIQQEKDSLTTEDEDSPIAKILQGLEDVRSLLGNGLTDVFRNKVLEKDQQTKEMKLEELQEQEDALTVVAALMEEKGITTLKI